MFRFFALFWKKIYKEPVRKVKEQLFLKRKLALVSSLYKEPSQYDREIIIIRTDDIGDYIVFRNMLEFLRKAKPGYKITLIGHVLWKNIAENWDAEFVDEFVWLERRKYMKDEAYATEFLKKLSLKKPEMVLAPANYRNPFIDNVMAAVIPARQKWATNRSNRETKLWLRKYVDKPYTNVFRLPFEIHEFDFSNQFMEAATGAESPFTKPYIDIAKLPPVEMPEQPYVVLFPGSAAKQKQWVTKHFATVADHIFEKYGIKSVVCGSKNDVTLFEKIAGYSSHKENIINYTGKTDLMQLATVISQCSLIVTNETGAAHYAASLGRNIVMALNGTTYRRVFPYPADRHPNMKCVYPPGIETVPFDWTGALDIQKITPEKIIKWVDYFLETELLSERS
ncbi:MAG TPA: glycosyltransferase family 9 protein [Bacteroidia bacterium]|nr:glycosyltransferase family 9 protein [Bacteroidia bacterium]